MDKKNIFLSAQRALLFNILISTRFIFIKNGINFIDIIIISDKELNEEEKDVYYSVLGEILGDFTEVDDSNSNVFFEYNISSFELIYRENYGDLIFARYEASMENGKFLVDK